MKKYLVILVVALISTTAFAQPSKTKEPKGICSIWTRNTTAEPFHKQSSLDVKTTKQQCEKQNKQQEDEFGNEYTKSIWEPLKTEDDN